ncbi:MAG: recombination mediator RecR [Planctomycetota bacterium]
MAQNLPVVEALLRHFGRLPGIGPRSAERIVFDLLRRDTDEVLAFAEALSDIKTKVKHCPITFNLTDGDRCRIYDNPRRNRQQVLVVEQPKDVIAIEDAGSFKGTYHVLLGRLAPLEGVEPEDLTGDALFKRVADDDVQEVILGTNPTLEGDTTALYLTDEIRKRRPKITITRLARGLAAGGAIEYANRSMLADALQNRQAMEGDDE